MCFLIVLPKFMNGSGAEYSILTVAIIARWHFIKYEIRTIWIINDTDIQFWFIQHCLIGEIIMAISMAINNASIEGSCKSSINRLLCVCIFIVYTKCLKPVFLYNNFRSIKMNYFFFMLRYWLVHYRFIVVISINLLQINTYNWHC